MATWRVLTAMTQTQAEAIKPSPGENMLQGWLALRQVWSDTRTAPDKMKAGVSAWQGLLAAASCREDAACPHW